MKHTCLAFITILLMSNILYAEDVNPVINEAETSSVQDTSLKLIVHTESLFNPFSFQYPDGSPLSVLVLNRLLNIPENQSLAKELNRAQLAKTILNVTSLAACGGMFVYIFAKDLPHTDIILPVLGSVAAGSVSGTLVAGRIGVTKFFRAIDNYNLSILGIQLSP